MAKQHRPWLLVAGFATAATGVILILLAILGRGAVAPPWSASAVVAAAIIELVAGLALSYRGGAGMAHIFSGALAISLALYLILNGLGNPGEVSAAPIALVLGMYCFCNGLFRGIDIVVDRPQAAFAESIDCVFTLVLGMVLFAHWRSASPGFIAVVAGIELLSGAIALLGSSQAWRRHPELPGYEGRVDRLAPVPLDRARIRFDR
jgi:hypothetical protein